MSCPLGPSHVPRQRAVADPPGFRVALRPPPPTTPGKEATTPVSHRPRCCLWKPFRLSASPACRFPSVTLDLCEGFSPAGRECSPPRHGTEKSPETGRPLRLLPAEREAWHARWPERVDAPWVSFGDGSSRKTLFLPTFQFISTDTRDLSLSTQRWLAGVSFL